MKWKDRKNLVNVSYETRYKYSPVSVDELRRGDVFINAYHDPEDIPERAGLYLTTVNTTFLRNCSKEAQDHVQAIVNVRSGVPYPIRYLLTQFPKGVYRVTIHRIEASVDRDMPA